MRGFHVMQASLFIDMTLSDLVPADHPLRLIREIVNTALAAMDATSEAMYANSGRDRSPRERLFGGNLSYNMLYRWFVGLGLDKAALDHSTYTKNRDRLIEHEVVRERFERVLDQARAKGLLFSKHFSAEGTLVRA